MSSSGDVCFEDLCLVVLKENPHYMLHLFDKNTVKIVIHCETLQLI